MELLVSASTVKHWGGVFGRLFQGPKKLGVHNMEYGDAVSRSKDDSFARVALDLGSSVAIHTHAVNTAMGRISSALTTIHNSDAPAELKTAAVEIAGVVDQINISNAELNDAVARAQKALATLEN